MDLDQTEATTLGPRAIERGVEFAFECVGHPALIRTAIDLLDWAGTCVILGVPPQGTEAAFNVSGLYLDKTIMGCRYGSARPHHDFRDVFYISLVRPEVHDARSKHICAVDDGVGHE